MEDFEYGMNTEEQPGGTLDAARADGGTPEPAPAMEGGGLA